MRARSSASLARRDRPRCPLLVDGVEDTSDRGAGLDPELVPADERRGRLGEPCGLHDAVQLRGAEVRERIERPGLGRAPESVDRSRGEISRPSERDGGRSSSGGARWRSEAVRRLSPKTTTRRKSGWSRASSRSLSPPPERLEQTDLVQAPESRRRQPLQLGEDALARRTRHERGRRPQQGFRALVHAKRELVLEANGPQEPERIVDEDRLRDRSHEPRLEVAPPVMRVVRLARRDALGDRVEREVPRREITVDPLGERREVDGLLDSHVDDAPRAVPFREREHDAAEAPREAVRRLARIRAGHVHVQDGP